MKYIPALAVVVTLTGASVSHAAFVDFVPRFAWFGGDLEITGDYAATTQENSGRTTKDQLRGIQQKLIVETLGYVYHPSLLYFEGQMALDVSDDQRKRTGASGEGEWRDNKAAREEYNLYGLVLGRKPLNLDFHISQERPFLTSGYTDSSRTVAFFKAGATLNYKKKPLISSLSYEHNSTETSVDPTTAGGAEQNFTDFNDAVSARVNYRQENYSVGAYITHSEAGVKGDSLVADISAEKDTHDLLTLNSTLRYKNYFFTSVAEVDNRTWGRGDRFRGLLKEEIDIDLPWDMKSEVNLYYESREENLFDAQGTIEDHKKNDDTTLNTLLEHQLFDSVFSTLIADYQKNKSTTSDRVSQNYRLSVHYNKKLRRGGITALAENDFIRIEQQGTPRIDDERHDNVIVFVGDSFTVDRPNAIKNTVNVEVFNTECKTTAECLDFEIDPVTGLGGEWQTIPGPGDQWSFGDPGSNRLEIKFDRAGAAPSIAPALDKFAFTPTLQDLVKPPSQDPNSHYLIRISYGQPEANFEIQSSTSSLSADINLFEGLFFGYLDHLLTSQEYIKGDHTFGELAPTVIANEIGVGLVKNPFKADIFYRIVSSDLRDEQRWKINGHYSQNATPFYKIAMHWGAKYSLEELSEEDAAGAVLQSTETEFVARAGVSSMITHTPILASFNSTFTRHTGGVNQHDINRDGIWETIDTTTDNEEKDTYDSRLNMGMMLPYINMKVNLFGRYQIEDNFTTGIRVVTKDLGFNTGRSKSWRFGGTSIILEGVYNFDISRIETTNSLDVVRNNRTTEDELELTFTLRRSLF